MNGKDVKTFIKYTFVGTIGLVLDIAALYALVEFVQVPVLIATPTAFMVAIINNFFFHKYWTFHDKSKHIAQEFFSFFVISIANLILTVGFMYVFVEVLFIWYILSKLITSIIILVFSYTMNRLWTFKKLN